ncbi:MAG: endolytic transglycosylase MltG [Phocaeicola sp.]|uniref:endolytic transglycosylase MltG n=2 Tax=Phocaeicola sp. TaxID=2773926 RepID=UPI003FA0829D
MKKQKRNIIIGIVCGMIIIACGTADYVYHELFSPSLHNSKTAYIYIDRDDNADSIFIKVQQIGKVKNMNFFKLLAKYNHLEQKIHTGRYEVKPGDNIVNLYRKLIHAQQTPMMLTIPSTRTIGQLFKALDRQLMLDSAEIIRPFRDSLIVQQLGFNEQTLPAFFIPDTYQFYWNVSEEALLKKLKQAYDNFWNQKRIEQAKAIGLTPTEVSTLASIVDEETAKNEEKPVIAGLYMNRLHKGMLLQADPTVKFAQQDPSIKRILFKHLEIDSPYNTYKNPGLPPGPIRIPSVQGLESVLNYAHHNYLYMCAKEDFSGYHNFAENNIQHAANARRYQQALNQRNIK